MAPYVQPGPAYREERTPGAPPSASTNRPVSSAIAGSPVASTAATALSAAFSSSVSPVSSTSQPGRISVTGTSSTPVPARSGAISSTL